MKSENNTENTAGSDCQERLVSRSFVAEQFARFRSNRERQHQIEIRRGGSFGIAVHNDEAAVEWRTHCREVEESQAFLENRRPIPEGWGESSSANKESPSPSLTLAVADRIFENALGRISAEPARVRTDAEGRITEINPAFSGLCGYQFEEIRGRKPGTLLQGPATTPESILALREAIRDRKKCCVEMLNYHKDHSTYRVQIFLTPQFNLLGDLEGFEAEEHKLD